MIKNLLLALSLLSINIAQAQMNFEDSTVQVITFWDLDETYEYEIEFQQIKLKGEDTVSNELSTYDVVVTVIDSTADDYTIRWDYKNFTNNSENPIIQKIMTSSSDISVEVKIDPLGVFQEVVNWEEVRDYISESFDTLEQELPPLPEVKKMLQSIETMYGSKAAVEAKAIEDLRQFHFFHGNLFDLKEPFEGTQKVSNLFNPAEPFDSDVNIYVEEASAEDEFYQIRSITEINSEQLTAATYNFIKPMLESADQEVPPLASFPSVTNTVECVSVIHNTGWVLSSKNWKETVSETSSRYEIRTIQMK